MLKNIFISSLNSLNSICYIIDIHQKKCRVKNRSLWYIVWYIIDLELIPLN